jgi:uncharacterized damage-inducible protein DinB
MEIIPMLLKEMEQEAQTTRKMLAIIPNDKFDWQPHPKSMTIRKLATHLAELPNWVKMALTTSELDFAANPYTLPELNNTAELLAFFEKCYADGYSQLAQSKEEDLLPGWILRSGDYIIQNYTVAEVIRVAFAQTTHHRAQLGVFLRLLNVPIPGSYGPSADELAGLMATA